MSQVTLPVAVSDIQARSASSRRVNADDDARLRDACEQFEAYFATQLLKEMRRAVPDDGLIPRSDAEKTFQELLDGETGLQIGKTHAMGLADMLYRQVRDTVGDMPRPQVSGQA